MKVAKWGNSLAVRLPAELVAELGLVEGDELQILKARRDRLDVERKQTKEEALAKLRSLRGLLPADYKFNREEANRRGPDDAE